MVANVSMQTAKGIVNQQFSQTIMTIIHSNGECGSINLRASSGMHILVLFNSSLFEFKTYSAYLALETYTAAQRYRTHES